MQKEIQTWQPWMASACAEIAKTAPDPWQLSDFETLHNKSHNPCWVLLLQNEPVGFACFLSVADIADLQFIAITPSFRGQGHAEFLLQTALQALGKTGVQKVLLELRCGNAPALALYQKLGFQTLAVRKNMYRNPTEDGFLMAKTL